MIPTRALAILCMAILVSQRPYVLAQQPQAAAQGQPEKTLTAAQLDSLVAPIALYPDPLLSQVLVASTYPLEIVEAARWLKQHSNLSGKALADAAEQQSWDASVQALVLLPDVLQHLSQNITWTADLGNAFLAQEQDVMEAFQRMRKRASDRGVLQSTKEQTVSTTTENNQTYIQIEPASPEVVYVPTYDPAAIWGPPPLYYPYPAIYYPPSTGAAIAAGAISFGAGVAVGAFFSGGWNNWGWNCGWGHHNVIVNNNFINSNRFNRVNVGNGNAWVHNPAHRDGVPYGNRGVANRFQGAAGNLQGQPTIAQTQQKLNQASIGNRGAAGQLGTANLGQRRLGSADRLAPGAQGQLNFGGNPAQGSAGRLSQGAADRIGNRRIQGAPPRGVFGGMNQGRDRAMMNGNRGSTSLSSGGFRGGGFGGGGRRR